MESALISFLNSLKSLKLWQILVLFVVLFGAAGATYEVYGRSTAVPLVDLDENQQIIPVQYGDLVNKVSTSGNLVYPEREALSFGSQGIVESILVEEGDRVTRGQPLAEIDQATVASIELAVAQAEIDLDVAQQALDELLAIIVITNNAAGGRGFQAGSVFSCYACGGGIIYPRDGSNGDSAASLDYSGSAAKRAAIS